MFRWRRCLERSRSGFTGSSVCFEYMRLIAIIIPNCPDNCWFYGALWYSFFGEAYHSLNHTFISHNTGDIPEILCILLPFFLSADTQHEQKQNFRYTLRETHNNWIIWNLIQAKMLRKCFHCVFGRARRIRFCIMNVYNIYTCENTYARSRSGGGGWVYFIVEKRRCCARYTENGT